MLSHILMLLTHRQFRLTQPQQESTNIVYLGAGIAGISQETAVFLHQLTMVVLKSGMPSYKAQEIIFTLQRWILAALRQ
jgi:hypothetical protein